MSEKYIRQNKSSFSIVKDSKVYARITLLDDAVFIRDLLIENNWDLDKIPKTVRKDDNYLVLAVIDERIHLLAKYKSEPDKGQIQNLTKKFTRNPNNSRYGLNITRIFDTFVIKKRIAGEDYIFGYYDNLEDAQFVRNFLLDSNWNVNEFSEIEFDEETNTYKAIALIDDKVYIINTYESKDEINLKDSYEKFLAKISKHKYGLASHPELDSLKDKIPELEDQFAIKARDDVWSFENIDDSQPVLNQVVFNLTPFQKSVYDSVTSNTSLEEIEKSLIRYKSKNFTDKILKNIDGLLELRLIEKTSEGNYSKTNF